jgi:hypothetical protein
VTRSDELRISGPKFPVKWCTSSNYHTEKEVGEEISEEEFSSVVESPKRLL